MKTPYIIIESKNPRSVIALLATDTLALIEYTEDGVRVVNEFNLFPVL